MLTRCCSHNDEMKSAFVKQKKCDNVFATIVFCKHNGKGLHLGGCSPLI